MSTATSAPARPRRRSSLTLARPTRRLRRALSIRTIAAAALATAIAACNPAPSEGLFVQSADGLTGYLGVAPSAVVAAHPPEHAERRMHAAARSGNAHLLVALFDDSSGQRVEDAAVEAIVRGDRHGGARRVRLEPMRVDGALTYGGFTTLAAERYHVDVQVRVQGAPRVVHLRFILDAAALPSAGR